MNGARGCEVSERVYFFYILSMTALQSSCAGTSHRRNIFSILVSTKLHSEFPVLFVLMTRSLLDFLPNQKVESKAITVVREDCANLLDRVCHADY